MMNAIFKWHFPFRFRCSCLNSSLQRRVHILLLLGFCPFSGQQHWISCGDVLQLKKICLFSGRQGCSWAPWCVWNRGITGLTRSSWPSWSYWGKGYHCKYHRAELCDTSRIFTGAVALNLKDRDVKWHETIMKRWPQQGNVPLRFTQLQLNNDCLQFVAILFRGCCVHYVS